MNSYITWNKGVGLRYKQWDRKYSYKICYFDSKGYFEYSVGSCGSGDTKVCETSFET